MSARRLPGDYEPSLAAMLRVNHAGEYGATRIYAGQLAVLGNSSIAPELNHMAAQEQAHLDAFNRLLPQHGVRPTALLPLWHLAGYVVGAATALMGAHAAMACTVAVESAITRHYDEQLKEGVLHDAVLHQAIQKFRDEEQEHHDLALQQDAEKAPFYQALRATIEAGCRVAIALSKRI